MDFERIIYGKRQAVIAACLLIQSCMTNYGSTSVGSTADKSSQRIMDADLLKSTKLDSNTLRTFLINNNFNIGENQPTIDGGYYFGQIKDVLDLNLLNGLKSSYYFKVSENESDFCYVFVNQYNQNVNVDKIKLQIDSINKLSIDQLHEDLFDTVHKDPYYFCASKSLLIFTPKQDKNLYVKIESALRKYCSLE